MTEEHFTEHVEFNDVKKSLSFAALFKGSRTNITRTSDCDEEARHVIRTRLFFSLSLSLWTSRLEQRLKEERRLIFLDVTL